MGPAHRRQFASPSPGHFGYENQQVVPKRKLNLSAATAKGHGGGSRNAARERYRVRSLRIAFHNLQKSLPSVPPNTKLSKLDVLILAATYISQLRRILSEDDNNSAPETNSYSPAPDSCAFPVSAEENETRRLRWENSYLHPVRKWPMRSRLYAGVEENDASPSSCINPPVLQRRNAWTRYSNVYYANE